MEEYLGSERENLIRPIFNELSTEEFNEKYPGKKPVFPWHLTNDEDYIPADGGEDIIDFV